MIEREIEAQILRLHSVEKWKVGTIAAQLQLHHSVVERVIERVDAPKAVRSRSSRLDPYMVFVHTTLAKWPKLPASRLYEMCKERGLEGVGPDHFRHMIAPHRPKRQPEPYLRLAVLPGEQAQVDWGHFGRFRVGRAERPLMAFVMVLAWCRAIYLRFFLGQCLENFLRGHEGAYEFFAGVARVNLYDNLKSAVTERVGQAIRFNRTLVDFSAHYRYEPRPVAPGRGNEKPRVERAIRYVRGNFYQARSWNGLEDLNEQALAWCLGTALDRPWPQDPQRKVREVFEEEKGKLLPLPADRFPTDERREASVQKTPYVRFDLNDYSVPHEYVRRTVVVVASLSTVRILSGDQEVAQHARSFDKGKQVEDARHIEALVETKAKARKQRHQDRLAQAAPSSRDLLCRLAEQGANLGNATQKLTKLLDIYGAERLEAAVAEALSQGVPHPHAVRQILERNRQAEGKPPALAIPVPDNPQLRGLAVRPHSLEGYDALAQTSLDDEQIGGDDDGQVTVGA